MKSLEAKFRTMVIAVLALLGLGLAQNSLAQTVSVSPGDLSSESQPERRPHWPSRMWSP